MNGSIFRCRNFSSIYCLFAVMKDELATLTSVLYMPHHSLLCFCNSRYQAWNTEVEQAKDLLIQAWFYPSFKSIFTTYCLHNKGGWTLLVGDHQDLIASLEDHRLILKKIFFLIHLILMRSTNWVLSVFADETCYYFTFWFLEILGSIC